MTTYEVRRAQLRRLLNERFAGRQIRLAEAVNRSETYINRLLSDASSEHSKNLGEKLARDFERSLLLPVGWLDSRNNEETSTRARAPGILPPPPPRQTHTALSWTAHADLPRSDYALIPRKMVHLAAGSGAMSFEEEEGPPLAFRAAWLADQGLDQDQLVVAYVTGDSMCPALCDGDTILINLAENRHIVDGKVYAIRQGDDLRVKRIYKRTLSITLHSDNPQFPDEDIPIHQAGELKIIGRVIWSAGTL